MMKDVKRIGILITLGIVGVLLGAQSLPQTMATFRTAMMQLMPGLISKDRFSDPALDAQMKEGVSHFSSLVEGLKKHDQLKGLGYSVPAKHLRENAAAAKKAYVEGKKDLAWMHLRAVVHGCNQCHTQTGGGRVPPWQLTQEMLPKGSFAIAETWYMFRDYPRALEFYLSVISQYGLGPVTKDELRISLERVLTTTLRVDRAPKKAYDIIESAHRSENIPPDIKAEMKSWLDELASLKDVALPDMAKAEAVDAFADQVLRKHYPVMAHPGSRKASALLASGVLLEFVNAHEKSVRPRMLYWLGVALRDTDDSLFSTSSPNYLGECIRRFPKDAVARECFQALQRYYDEQFLGVTGEVGLPKDVQAELEALKQRLNAASKKKAVRISP